MSTGISVVPMMTPEQRAQRARIAAHESWARTPDRSARTAPARRGLDERFLREARERLGEHATQRAVQEAADSARSAHFRRMALRSARVRAYNRGAT